MFEKGSKPFQEILSTAEHAASRAAHSAKGICQAKLQAHVIPCRRHSSKRSLLCLIPASAAFHTVQKHAVLLVIWLQAHSLADLLQRLHIIPHTHVRHGGKIIPFSILLGKGIQYIHGFLIMSALNKISCCTIRFRSIRYC